MPAILKSGSKRRAHRARDVPTGRNPLVSNAVASPSSPRALAENRPKDATIRKILERWSLTDGNVCSTCTPGPPEHHGVVLSVRTIAHDARPTATLQPHLMEVLMRLNNFSFVRRSLVVLVAAAATIGLRQHPEGAAKQIEIVDIG